MKWFRELVQNYEKNLKEFRERFPRASHIPWGLTDIPYEPFFGRKKREERAKAKKENTEF